MRTIAIAGCVNRIGTTTQALQAVQVLKAVGYKAAYLEANRNQYLEQMVKTYSNVEESKQFIINSGIVLYKRNYSQAAKDEKYDFIVKDYGNVDTVNFEEASFAGQKTKIVVCGSKPNEIFKTQAVLANPIYDDAYLIFSFVPEEERVSVQSMMSEDANKTFFADTILDPFVEHPSSKALFHKILRFNKG
jgi:hypothetical protein